MPMEKKYLQAIFFQRSIHYISDTFSVSVHALEITFIYALLVAFILEILKFGIHFNLKNKNIEDHFPCMKKINILPSKKHVGISYDINLSVHCINYFSHENSPSEVWCGHALCRKACMVIINTSTLNTLSSLTSHSKHWNKCVYAICCIYTT